VESLFKPPGVPAARGPAATPAKRSMTREDVKSAAHLSRDEARQLVQLYYTWQTQRIALGNQLRELQESNPQGVGPLAFFYGESKDLEDQMVRPLKSWVESSEAGRWAYSQMGIGPVLAAGICAHIDPERAVVAGSVWRYAGLDPSLKWHGTRAGRELVAAAGQAEDTGVDAVLWLSKATNRRASDFFHAAGSEPLSREAAETALAQLSGFDADDVRERMDERPTQTEAAVEHAAEALGVPSREVYRIIFPDFGRAMTAAQADAMSKMLARRPWNAELKVLCWKIGDSFVKVSGKDHAFYGRLYRERKLREVEMNDAGAYAETAAEKLRTSKVQSAELRRSLEAGRLSAGHLDARARRWAVKLFLAHFHQVLRESHGLPVREPYPMEFQGHAHVIRPPGWPPSS
jgi:hypothetical protein